MIGQLTDWADGKKTYIFVILLTAYRVAVAHGWITPMSDVETALIAGIGLSAREAISKLEKPA